MNPAISEMTATYLVDAATSPVPQGYKQTDVGIIPDDWLCTDIGALNPFVTSGSRGWAEFYSEYGQPFVRITNTKRHSIYLDLSDLKFVKLPETSSEGKRTSLANGDVLISITADIGISSYVDDALVKPAYINQHIALVRFDLDEINSKFVTYFLSSENVQKLFRSTSDQGAKAGLNLDSVRKIQIALPSQSEQTAIANALSDVDALIQELEKLIAKKQAIKTATMQQLLTGRTRLPQFANHPDGHKKGYKPSELGEIPEDWEVVEFSSIVWFQEGPGVRQYQFTSAGIKLLNGTNIENGSLLLEKTQRYISEKLAYGQYSHFMIDAGDILIACSGVTIERFDEKVTIASNEDLPLCLNTSTMRFKVRSENTDKIFIKNFLKSSFFKNQIGGKATGSAQLNFGPYHVSQVRIAVPGKEEQTAIATILSDMDAEIQTLELRLNKTRQIKQGMMQELLTGKTRLVKPARSSADAD